MALLFQLYHSSYPGLISMLSTTDFGGNKQKTMFKYSHISNGLVKMCLSHLKSLETIIQIYKVSDSLEREMTL
jgi:hypothetical protein